MTIRVAHVLRGDHNHHVGGDLIQLQASVEGLCDLGIDAFATTSDDLDSSVNLVHIYNLQLPFELWRGLQRARQVAPRAPVVLSPIYWPVDISAVRAERRNSRVSRPLHWIGPRRRSEWLLNRRALNAVAAVLPNSQIETLRLQKFFRMSSSDRWRVVPNGLWIDRWEVDSSIRRTRGAPLRIACVARLEPQKNQRRLVEAVRRLGSADLTLVGPSGEHRYAASVLNELAALGARGRWIERLDQPHLKKLLSNVHVHVLPSFRETPGLASMEAAAAGCAIVTTKEGSAEEYFGDLASYSDPRSTTDISAAIAHAAAHSNQPALRKRMQQYDWSRVCKVLAQIYRDVLTHA